MKQGGAKCMQKRHIKFHVSDTLLGVDYNRDKISDWLKIGKQKSI